MHVVFLGIGLIIGLYSLYRFFLSATVPQMKAFALAVTAIVLSGSLFFLAVTGKLPAAIGIIAALIPFALPFLRRRAQASQHSSPANTKGEPLTRQDALEILGLKDNPTEDDIKAAYKKLMRKVHPDQDGSAWMARQLNAARDLLLERVDKRD